jgi:succinate dehydrogenase / fumarate reductase, flavoprotein subunit
VELLVYGRIAGRAAAGHAADLGVQRRSASVVEAARAEVDGLLAAEGPHNVRSLQRRLRDAMTEHAGVVRDETGLQAGLAELDAVEERMPRVTIHPDSAGFHDLAHAYDLRSSVLAARATLEAALERRATRGCHNRADHPEVDPALQVNLVWCGRGRVVREQIAPIPDDIAALMRDVSTAGKLLE